MSDLARRANLWVMDEPPSHYTENVARIIDRPGQLVIAATVNRRVEWLRKMVEGDTRPSEKDVCS
jgi:hypothetical protein